MSLRSGCPPRSRSERRLVGHHPNRRPEYLLLAFQSGQACDPGTGERLSGSYSGCCRCPESSSFSCGLGFLGSWPRRSVARPCRLCRWSIPFLSPGVRSRRSAPWWWSGSVAIPAPVRGDLLAFGAGLLCGIGEDQKRAAFGVGVDRGDTHPWEGWGLAPR